MPTRISATPSVSFVDEHLAAVNRRTTVIVLGDARNNYNLPHERALREIRRRAKRLIWLNPESRGTWGFGDSEMERYSVHCNVVEECLNSKPIIPGDRLARAALTRWFAGLRRTLRLTALRLWSKITMRSRGNAGPVLGGRPHQEAARNCS